MDRLPLEILEQIFILIPQRQKVECMCVKKSWKRLIKITCLFHTIVLTSQDNLNELITIIGFTPSMGTQVERLILYTDLTCGHLLTFFPTIFPNLKYFYRFANTPSSFNPLMEEPVWNNNRLQGLFESPFDTLSYRLLLSCKCDHLKTLYLNVFNIEPKNLVLAFRNAPNLVNLTLVNHELNFKELDQLDQLLPQLEKIKFHIVTPMDREIPREINPNTHIKTIDMRISRGGITEQVTLLGYLGLKYPALADFVYDAGELSLDPEHVGGGPDYSDVIYRPLIDAMMSTVAGLGVQLKRLKLLHEQLTPSHYLKINTPFKLDAAVLGLSAVDSAKMKRLFLTPTFNEITSLSLQFHGINNYTCLKALPHLKTLKIKHPRDDNIRLDLLMKCTHQLETLVLEDLIIKVNPNHPASYPLKHLKLNATSVSKNLDVFLARTCPHLRTLQLFNSVFPKATFSLPNVHLSHLKIIKRELPVEINPEYANDDANYMLVKTQAWQHLYFVGHRQPTQHGLKFFDRFDLPAYPTSKYYPYDALSRTPHIAFEIASVGHVDTATKWKVSEFYFY